MLILTAKLRARPGCRQLLIDLAEGAIGPSRSEEGCIAYEFYQDPFEQDCFLFFEKWRSMEDLLVHFEEPHFMDFVRKSLELVDGTTSLVRYEVMDESRIQ